eukprot:5820084-Lingulodinium_polyedra.AAC.1
MGSRKFCLPNVNQITDIKHRRQQNTSNTTMVDTQVCNCVNVQTTGDRCICQGSTHLPGDDAPEHKHSCTLESQPLPC